jgi:hypothetical protein
MLVSILHECFRHEEDGRKKQMDKFSTAKLPEAVLNILISLKGCEEINSATTTNLMPVWNRS